MIRISMFIKLVVYTLYVIMIQSREEIDAATYYLHNKVTTLDYEVIYLLSIRCEAHVSDMKYCTKPILMLTIYDLFIISILIQSLTNDDA